MHADACRQYVGQWVHCHSIYGVHQGVLYKVMRDGIIITQYTQLASYDKTNETDWTTGEFQSERDKDDITQVQFLFPGMFLPYRAMYGLWPVPFVI